MAPSIVTSIKTRGGAEPSASLYENARKHQQSVHDRLLKRSSGGENPYLLHQDLGQVMTKAATVVRVNSQLKEAYQKVSELAVRAQLCSLSDTGSWTNQNVVFTKALKDMFPLAKAILLGALQRDECRGAHFKPEFSMPGIDSPNPADHRRLAEQWCDRFEENTRKWLKTSVATVSPEGEPTISYEDVDTSLIPPRPRLYGLVGAEVIEEVWKARQAARAAGGKDGQPHAAGSKQGNGASAGKAPAATAAGH